ncbi:unnamed protein product [Calicophoron daubneyi]|uniref:Coiled-coil domain-containing protein 177 n=1 Tax=Calicophoron daubneyi TaxID=300641 RepID=A0AAV2TRE8_CALDB
MNANAAAPNIDLYNFEDPQFEDSRYVLTSPRSLEACARLNIRPIDLLPKSKGDFIASHKYIPQSKVEALYKDFEGSRKDKIAKARMERSRITNRINSCIDRQSRQSNGDTKSTSEDTERVVRARSSLGPRTTKEASRTLGAKLRPRRVQSTDKRLGSDCRDSFSGHYREVLRKLPPNEAKRLQLAHKQCMRLSSKIGKQQVAETLGRLNNDLIITGHKARSEGGERQCQSACHSPTQETPLKRWRSNSSLAKERDFWIRRRELEFLADETALRKIREMDEKDRRVREQKEIIQKQRENQLIAAHRERELRLSQAHERRKELDVMLDSYRKQLQELREETQQRARERASMRLAEEQRRLANERLQRETVARERANQIRMREEEWRKSAEHTQKQKDEYIQHVLAEREARIQESRALALASEKLRREMLRAYDLDSFDKKAQQVALINDLGLGARM